MARDGRPGRAGKEAELEPKVREFVLVKQFAHCEQGACPKPRTHVVKERGTTTEHGWFCRKHGLMRVEVFNRIARQ